MINATKDTAIFNRTGNALEADIRKAMTAAADWHLRLFGMTKADIPAVSTKTNLQIAYAALVYHLLDKPDLKFGESYVTNALVVANLPYSRLPEEHYYSVTLSKPGSLWGFKLSYGPRFRRGLEVFLAALHCTGAITLPFSFTWPRTPYGAFRKSEAYDFCDVDDLPELFRLIRSIPFDSNEPADPVFDTLTKRQQKHLWTYGTKILLATGWLSPDDVNLDDLVVLKVENDKTGFAGPTLFNQVLPLIDVLERKYGDAADLSVAAWHKVKKENKRIFGTRQGMRKKVRMFDPQVFTDADLLGNASLALPGDYNPGELPVMTSLPGLSTDIASLYKTWLLLEQAYLKRVRRESYKYMTGSLGYLNIYLFNYLPYWYAMHPACPVEFPDTPSKLLSSIFVSDLGVSKVTERPTTLVDFMAHISQVKEWKPGSHYAQLGQMKGFFEFLERYSSELPGCQGFKQPLTADDFPAMTRSKGTNKRPIPRRAFSVFLAYAEALAALCEAVLNRVVSGDLSDASLEGLNKPNVIDTFALQEVFGFIPVVFHQGRAVPLRLIPNVFHLTRMRLKDGRMLRIPQPHAIHQIVVALHTGIRHQHIQWLDAETFDAHHGLISGTEFTRLYVNTDKVKNSGWTPYVHRKVLDILAAQKRWRDLIGESGFMGKVHYNGNERSKWGSFYPLFSAQLDGTPHPDSRYDLVWRQLLPSIQALLYDLGDTRTRLYRFLPASVSYNDPNLTQELLKHGSGDGRVCELLIKSDITPHSARVSVVSHSITILPADVIGRFITGQNTATVYHYVSLDDDEVYAEQQLQKLALRNKGYAEGYAAMTAGLPLQSGAHIKADAVNSSLVQGIRMNLEATIASHGLTSFTLNEAMKTGIEILRETRAEGAVFNKTEICPYGNRCPADLIKQLEGTQRCALCPCAVRSIDHLPAVTAKYRQVNEMLCELDARLDSQEDSLTPDEYDRLAADRARLAEDMAGWRLVEEILEITRERIEAGASGCRWVVQKPDIVEGHLKRFPFPSQETEYVLARLLESEAFPTLESPPIRARFDLLRRQLLANVGNIRQAISSQIPVNPAAECLGLLRSVVTANKLSYRDVLSLLKTDDALEEHPRQELRLLPAEVSV